MAMALKSQGLVVSVMVMMIVLMVVTMARNLCIKSNYGAVCDGVCNDDNDDLLKTTYVLS